MTIVKTFRTVWAKDPEDGKMKFIRVPKTYYRNGGRKRTGPDKRGKPSKRQN